jgi:hypothetical protein
LLLQLIIRTKCIHIRGDTIQLAGPTEFAKSQNPIGSKVVDLEMENFKNLAKEADGGQAKATGEIVPEHNSVALS